MKPSALFHYQNCTHHMGWVAHPPRHRTPAIGQPSVGQNTCIEAPSCSGRDTPFIVPQAVIISSKRRNVIAQACPSHLALFAAITTAAKAGSTAASNTAPSLISTQLPPLLTSTGILIICIAGAIFLLNAIPTLWALARLALAATAVLRQVERELPETAALLRLTGMEVTECVSELSSLGSDLTAGVRSTANIVTMTETGIKQTATVATKQIAPALAAGETHARGAMEAGLQERAKLNYTLPVIAQVASGTTNTVRRLKLGVALAKAAGSALQLGKLARDNIKDISR